MDSGYSTDNRVRDLVIDSGAPLRTDGPTLEEYLDAGYQAANYPPAGWAEKPSDGLTLFRTTGQLPVVPNQVPAVTTATAPPQDLPPAAADVSAGDVPAAEDAPVADVPAVDEAPIADKPEASPATQTKKRR